MLRDMPEMRTGSSGGMRRAASIAALSAAVVFVAGFRGTGAAPALAQTASSGGLSGGQAATDIDVMSMVPADATMVLDLRPSEILKSPEAAKFVADLGVLERFRKQTGLDPATLRRVVLSSEATPTPPGGPAFFGGPPLVIVVSEGDQDWAALKAGLVPDPVAVSIAGASYMRSGTMPGAMAYYQKDDRVFAFGAEGFIKKLVFATVQPPRGHAFDDALDKVSPGPLRVAATSIWTSTLLAQPGGPGPQNQWIATVGPLVNGAVSHAASLDTAKGLTLDFVTIGVNDAAAAKAAKTLEAVVTLAENALEQAATAPAPSAQPGLPGPMGSGLSGMLAKSAGPVLSNAKVTREGTLVRLRSETSITMADLARDFAPAIVASRIAAARSQSVNNLKQIALAFHNYASANDRFPPAVLYGPDGKTPHSWRVAILPYLEQQSLYNEYRFDQPWDSPANKKVLEKIPAVYRANGDKTSATSSSYYAPVGPGTLFSGKEGTRFADIYDGTSNTIMIVEASHDIPWTKPEDLPVEDGKPLPKFGGIFEKGFDAAFADGSVRFFKESIQEQVLRALLSSKGGEVISSDAF